MLGVSEGGRVDEKVGNTIAVRNTQLVSDVVKKGTTSGVALLDRFKVMSVVCAKSNAMVPVAVPPTSLIDVGATETLNPNSSLSVTVKALLGLPAVLVAEIVTA